MIGLVKPETNPKYESYKIFSTSISENLVLSLNYLYYIISSQFMYLRILKYIRINNLI